MRIRATLVASWESPGHWSRLVPIAAAMVVLATCSDGSSPTDSGPDDDPTPDPPELTFPTVQETVDQMNQVASAYPGIALLVDLTQTYGTPPSHEGRHIYALKISDNPALEEDEPAFLLVSAHHGNEIGTPVVALDAIDRFTQGYASDPNISTLVDEYEIWIVAVWNVDGYPETRKNKRPGHPVDLNRNYPFLWDSSCSGSADPASGTYRGPSAGSEPETQTMLAFAEDQRFTKVLDFHSSGREVVYGYRCSPHQLSGYLQGEAIALSEASSYGGDARQPSGEGEHYHWQLGEFSNYAFLMEIGVTQTPTYASAQNEAARVWPGTLWMLHRPIPVWGHVVDEVSGAPLSANISYLENPFTQGEKNTSEPRFGRYHAFLPLGEHTLRFACPGYATKDVPVTVTETGVRVEVALNPVEG